METYRDRDTHRFRDTHGGTQRHIWKYTDLETH